MFCSLGKCFWFINPVSVKYTTDLNSSYSSILIAEVNSKTIKLIEENYDKQIIFVTHLEEKKILRSFNFNNKRSIEVRTKYINFLNKCNIFKLFSLYAKKIFYIFILIFPKFLFEVDRKLFIIYP